MPNLKKYGANLYQLQHFGMLNVYLVEEEKGLTLIDTGISSTAQRIIQAVNRLQKPLERILITHAHDDHVGGLDILHAEYPEAEIMISRRDAKWLAGDNSLEINEPAIPLNKQNLNISTRPTRLLEAGESVGNLQVYDAAGHSPGQLAFLDIRDGSLIAGDAFITLFGFGGIAVAGTKGIARWRFALPHLTTWSAELALKNAKLLTALNPSHLAVGHGRVIEDPTEKMNTACAYMDAIYKS